MKKLMFIAVISLMAASMAMADVSCTANALSTGTGAGVQFMNLDGSSNGFSCHIGNLDFSNWSETWTPFATGVKPAAITATPLTTPGNEGFMFTAFWTATAPGATEDSTINYTVTDLAGPFLHDLDLAFNGSFGGDGAAHVTEKWCLNGDPTLCKVQTVTNPPLDLHENFVLASNVTSLTISKDIGVSAGSNGNASISQVSNNYSQVPEPRLISLLSMALLAGLGLSKKFKNVLG